MIVTPGNHDTPYWNLPLRALVPFDRYRRYIGPADSTAFDAPGLSARSLNSARGAQPRLDWSKGAVALAKLKRLQWGPGVRIFACHHPFVDIAGAPVTGGVRRGALAAKLLAESGVELVLTGHVHVPFALPLTLASEGCYAVGAGTLSRRTRGAPPSFSAITLTDAAFEVSVQAWTGDRFEAGEAWRLPSRAGRRPFPQGQSRFDGRATPRLDWAKAAEACGLTVETSESVGGLGGGAGARGAQLLEARPALAVRQAQGDPSGDSGPAGRDAADGAGAVGGRRSGTGPFRRCAGARPPTRTTRPPGVCWPISCKRWAIRLAPTART